MSRLLNQYMFSFLRDTGSSSYETLNGAVQGSNTHVRRYIAWLEEHLAKTQLLLDKTHKQKV